MNTELQKSFQVAGMVGELDGYLLMVLGIMVLAGILGGFANYFLSERQEDTQRNGSARYLVLGVIAALTVPLFLNMLSSNLLEAARTRPSDFFVFAGFCLIYVVMSRRVFENAAQRLMGQIESMKRDVNQIRKMQAETPPAIKPTPPVEVPAPPKEALSYNDIEILRAISEESYIYGNLIGLTEKTGLSRELVSNRLTVLKSYGIIETRINDKNVLHWYVSTKGRQVLVEILAQGERKSA